LARWRGLGSTLGQAKELISGPSPGAKTRLLSFSRTQSRVVTGLLAGPNTLKRHLHLMGLTNSPLCRRCGVEDETSAHILCECEALASHRHVYLGSFLRPRCIGTVRARTQMLINQSGLPSDWESECLRAVLQPFICVGSELISGSMKIRERRM